LQPPVPSLIASTGIVNCQAALPTDQDAIAALRESTGLNFRAEGSAVIFELADDNNPGKTQTVAVRADDADLE
jgi:hypothetical protein